MMCSPLRKCYIEIYVLIFQAVSWFMLHYLFIALGQVWFTLWSCHPNIGRLLDVCMYICVCMYECVCLYMPVTYTNMRKLTLTSVYKSRRGRIVDSVRVALGYWRRVDIKNLIINDAAGRFDFSKLTFFFVNSGWFGMMIILFKPVAFTPKNE